jgi:hypothetical protein
LQALLDTAEISQVAGSVQGLLNISDWLTAADTLEHARVLCSRSATIGRLDSLNAVLTSLDEFDEKLHEGLVKAFEDAASFKGIDEVILAICEKLQVCFLFVRAFFHVSHSMHRGERLAKPYFSYFLCTQLCCGWIGYWGVSVARHGGTCGAKEGMR